MRLTGDAMNAMKIGGTPPEFRPLAEKLVEIGSTKGISVEEIALLGKLVFPTVVRNPSDSDIQALKEKISKLTGYDNKKMSVVTKLKLFFHQYLNPFRISTETFKTQIRDAYKASVMPRIFVEKDKTVLQEPDFWALDSKDREFFLKELGLKETKMPDDPLIQKAVNLFGSKERQKE